MACSFVLTVIQDREPLGILPLNECSLSFKVLSGLRTIILAKFDKSTLPFATARPISLHLSQRNPMRAPPSSCSAPTRRARV